MNIENERKRFNQRYEKNVEELIIVTGPSGVSGGKAGGEKLWRASINLICFKSLITSEISREELNLSWLADDRELDLWREKIPSYSVHRVTVRRGKYDMMMEEHLERIEDDLELNRVIEEDKKPVYYSDSFFGEFSLEKTVKVFEKKINWVNRECILTFDLEEEEEMKTSLKVAENIYINMKEWDLKFREFAAKELLELSNEWLEDEKECMDENESAQIESITKENFMKRMAIESISVRADGEFDVFFEDGGLFWGHCIIVSGNIDTGVSSAEMAG